MIPAFIVGIALLLFWVANYRTKAQEMWQAVFGQKFSAFGF